jgi:hypothetical protein
MNELLELANLQQELKARRIRLALTQDILVVNAPKGSITPELKMRLQQHKPQLIQFLRLVELEQHGAQSLLADHRHTGLITPLYPLPLQSTKRREILFSTQHHRHCLPAAIIGARTLRLLQLQKLGFVVPRFLVLTVPDTSPSQQPAEFKKVLREYFPTNSTLRHCCATEMKVTHNPATSELMLTTEEMVSLGAEIASLKRPLLIEQITTAILTGTAYSQKLAKDCVAWEINPHSDNKPVQSINVTLCFDPYAWDQGVRAVKPAVNQLAEEHDLPGSIIAAVINTLGEITRHYGPQQTVYWIVDTSQQCVVVDRMIGNVQEHSHQEHSHQEHNQQKLNKNIKR